LLLSVRQSASDCLQNFRPPQSWKPSRALLKMNLQMMTRESEKEVVINF
jgi:hypothetical protein